MKKSEVYRKAISSVIYDERYEESEMIDILDVLFDRMSTEIMLEAKEETR